MLNFLFCYDLVEGSFTDFLWEFDYIKCSTWLKSETWEYLRVDRWSGQCLKTLLDHRTGGNLQLSWTSWRQSRGKGGGSVAVTSRSGSRGNHCSEKKVLWKYLKISLRGMRQMMRGGEEEPQDRAWGDVTFLQSAREIWGEPGECCV